MRNASVRGVALGPPPVERSDLIDTRRRFLRAIHRRTDGRLKRAGNGEGAQGRRDQRLRRVAARRWRGRLMARDRLAREVDARTQHLVGEVGRRVRVGLKVVEVAQQLGGDLVRIGTHHVRARLSRRRACSASHVRRNEEEGTSGNGRNG